MLCDCYFVHRCWRKYIPNLYNGSTVSILVRYVYTCECTSHLTAVGFCWTLAISVHWMNGREWLLISCDSHKGYWTKQIMLSRITLLSAPFPTPAVLHLSACSSSVELDWKLMGVHSLPIKNSLSVKTQLYIYASFKNVKYWNTAT